ncbi:MAG: S1/P1 nuclease [Gemmataceae bacterium]|nr:S1/P1 nuclease [Gemmataceae bacterium]
MNRHVIPRTSWGFLVAMLAFVPVQALAWSGPGHMTVVKLAWDGLDRGQRDAISQALRQHPHWKEFFLERRKDKPDGIAEDEWDFLVASTWADWLRGYTQSQTPEGKAIAKYHRGKQHYINKPFVLPADEDLFKDKKLEPDRENVVNALKAYVNQLKSENATAPQKALALCWLLHLVGDIHQPLHAVAFYSKEYERGDEGGNLWWVKDGERPVRLHAYWDGLLGSELDYRKSYPRVKTNVELLTRPEFQREKFPEELKRTDFDQWADESLALARSVAYREGKLPGLRIARDQETEERKAEAPALPEDYAPSARRAAEQRIALAGHRLLDQLGNLFPKKSP